MAGLFDLPGAPEKITDGLVIIREGIHDPDAVLREVHRIAQQSPWRTMITPGGKTMSVEMTNAGAVGWISDRRGYRYEDIDPVTGEPWPAIHNDIVNLVRTSAMVAGYPGFEPDVCLVNRYRIGAKMSLHQDRDEADFSHPIVSFSLGMSATFLFGGLRRTDPTLKLPLHHGDIVVWGGSSRLHYHGIASVNGPAHSMVGPYRINLTFRRAHS